VSAASGGLNSWDPALQGDANAPKVNALAASGSRIYLMGLFVGIGGFLNSNVAEVSQATVGVSDPPLAGLRLSLSIQPNPFHAGNRIRFFLPRASEVSLSVYDVSGREVARLLERKPFDAGSREVRFDGRGLRSGVYLCSLRTVGEAISRRIVFIP
jgi:hypothetical protein